MELISKEVVRRIIDSGRTREQMLGMVECAVTFRRWKSSTESTDSSTESPTDSSTVSLAVFDQVKWERDVALEQLKELGYGFGEKIRTDEDCISREAVLDTTICEGISCNECSFNEIDGEPGCLLHKRISDLPSVKPKADVNALINKIETELSWSMYDDWGNSTDLHDGLVDIIREWVEVAS